MDNNIVGQLPDCFFEIEASSISLPLNEISGPFPNVSDSLKSIDMFGNLITQLPPNWCAVNRSSIRLSGNPISQHGVDPCYLR